jgi:glycosyltransferase involved in cell wall biosynthesis/2-polyprenyl-3-methyl-5-hydroxy-6-metoxy-1,4-benzoquinol methylase
MKTAISKMVITLAIPGLSFNGKTFDQQSLGGSESAGYYMARALAKLGHSVTVFCGTDQIEHCEDVDYLPLSLFRQYVEYTPHDVCIVQRAPDMLVGHCLAKLSILWCHDLALRRAEGIYKGVSWNFDKIFVLSEFMRKQYRDVYGLQDSQLFVTRNGVDLDTVRAVHDTVAQATDVKRNPLSMVYAGRPERGLDILLAQIMPRILRLEPQARLFTCAYANPVDTLTEFYAHCTQLATNLGPAVVQLGSLTKSQLYEVFHSAGLYVYPVPSMLMPEFDEVSCISVMEAQACGLPVVTSGRGALPETLAPDAGILVQDEVHTPAYFDAFAEACVRFMRSPAAWRKASAAGLARAESLHWDGAAEQWAELFATEISARSADLATLANHFWRRSDIYAAKECLRRLPPDDEKSAHVRERIAQDWAFLDEPDGFRKQYEKIGATHNAQVIHWAPHEPRYGAIKRWLEAHTHDVRSVLDYGCAHGAYATNLLKEFPDLAITGVDIDLRGIQLADQFAETLGVSRRWRGVVGDYQRLLDTSIPEFAQQYDCAVAQEVLEHVESPSAVLQALEERVRDGGYVYITVPYGPWEYSDYRRYPHRAHIWEFDLHDLHEMLDVKGPSAQVSISAMPYGHNPETDDPMGWWVVQYLVTPESRGKVGKIDMERKLRCQRPRQTVSGLIMAGPGCEETLHWCLKSLTHVVDELVVADCGMSEEAVRVLEQYRWRALDGQPHAWFPAIKRIPAGNPTVDGFEAPRNLALKNCTQDWILWIDTDEKILQPNMITKYLRPNCFAGYSIRQHHFAVDVAWSPDLPVRMFRNNGKMRFFGMIHEHPEEAINKGPGLTIVLPDVHIPHVGYLIESGRQVKFHRNLPMLEADIKKYPDRILQKHFIMRDKMLLVGQELRANGQKITEPIKQLCRDVVAIYREHFLGKGHFTNVDPFEYYSQANAVLAQGIDVAFSVAVDKIDAKPNGMTKGRFASSEDFILELSRRAKEAAAPFETRYW